MDEELQPTEEVVAPTEPVEEADPATADENPVGVPLPEPEVPTAPVVE